MTPGTPRFLVVAAAAACLQAVTTLGSIAWLSRTVPISDLGRFGLYLAILSLAMAMDGIRQIVLVRSASTIPAHQAEVAGLAGVAAAFAMLFGVSVAWVNLLVLNMTWQESIPIASACVLLLMCGPAFGRLESAGRAHHAMLLHSVSWSLGLVLACVSVAWSDDMSAGAWAMLMVPVCNAAALRHLGAWVRPTVRVDRAALRTAFQGIGSHSSTALGNFVDKGVLAAYGGPLSLGMYTPLSELIGRASALSGMACNLFLNHETRAAAPDPSGSASETARIVIDGMFIAGAFGICVAAVTAPSLLRAYIVEATPAQVLAMRLLLAGLAFNLGAQWSAVALRARGIFDFYRPYFACLTIATLSSPVLIARHGLPGAAGVFLIVRSADLILMYRARSALSPIQIVAPLASAMFVLALAVSAP